MIYRIASESMTDYGFSEYNLARRSISFLQPLFMIGLGVGIPRYTSKYPQRTSILTAGIILMTIAAFVLSAIVFIGREYFATLFFGDLSYQSYIAPLLLMLFGFCFHAILYGFLRGKHNVYFANGIQLLNIGVIPILVLLYTSNVLNLLYFTGVFLILSCFGIVLIVMYQYQSTFSKKKLMVDSKTLLRYGLPRVLGDFSLLALITAPTYLVLYFQDDLLISGDVAYAITLLNLVGAAFAPLGLVILPEVATFLNEKNHNMIRRRFRLFVIMSLIATVFGYVVYYFFSDFILSILLGSGYRHNIVKVSLIILSGSFGYGLYIILRSFLDAIKVQATNAFNLIITLIFYFALIVYNYNQQAEIEAYLISFAVSMTFLGIITLIQTHLAIKRM